MTYDVEKCNIYLDEIKGGFYMLASQIREKARNALSGKWGTAALLTLSYVVLVFIIEWIAGLLAGLIPFLGFLISIALLVINVPLSFGFVAIFMKLKRNEQVGYADFLSIAFSNIGNAWKVAGNIILRLLPFIIGIIVSIFLMSFGIAASIFSAFPTATRAASATAVSGFGFLGIIGFIGYLACIICLIPKTLSYALSYFILFDNPEMSGKEIVGKSQSLMIGKRWKLFCLSFSFIGWMFLAGLTFGIGYFWVLPYIMFAIICFYEELNGSNIVESTSAVEDNDNNPIQGE